MTFVKKSTGWVNETLTVLAIVLLLAAGKDLAVRYGLPTLADTAAQVLGIASGILALFAARRREWAKREAQEVASGRAGA